MDKKSIKKNYFYNLTYQILTIIIPLLTAPYISRVLGADGVGTVSYVESIVTYFTMFAVMGIAIYGQREISYVQDSPVKRSIVFWNAKIFELFSSSIVLAIYLLFSYQQSNRILYIIYVLPLLNVIADVSWFFQGMEEFGIIVVRNIIIKIVNIIYIFVVVKDKEDIYKYAFGIVFFTVLSSVSLWLKLPRYLVKISKSDLHPFKNFRTILSLFIPTIAIQIYTVLDKTMIGVITRDSFENGYYEQAIKLSKMVLTIVTALGTVMIPRIGHYFEQKEEEKIQSLMYRGYRVVWLLGIPLCFGLNTVSSNFVPWFFGEGYEAVIPLLKILSFLILAIGINNVTGTQYFIPTKRQNLFTFTVILGAVVNLFLNFFLIRKYSSAGAAVSSVLAETVIACVQLIIVRKELSPLHVLREGTNYFIAGTVMAVVLWLMEPLLLPSIISTVFMVGVGSLIYFGILLILKDEFLVSNMNQFMTKIRRK
ncbi:MAG: flippase [Acetatifactor sp.]|nr:flippase [Acetatifactor sp.]